MGNNITTALTILLVCNSFLAGIIWEGNDYEPLKLRAFLTLLHLVLGVPIHVLSFLYNVTAKPRLWIESRTQLWFWITWPFNKEDRFKGFPEEYYEHVEKIYTKNKGKFGPFHWSTRQAAKKILILNDRKLP